MAWFNPGRWIAILLFFLALYLAHNYDKRQAVNQALTTERNAYAALALAASEANRVKEKALKLSTERVRNDYQKQKAINADLARANADRLRDYQAALDRAASGDSSTSSGVNAVLAGITRECGIAVQALDEHAQGLRATARALQDFANVRLKD